DVPRGPGRQEQLPFVAHQIARERQVAPPVAEDLPEDRHRGARVQAPPDGHMVAVLDQGRRLGERHPFVAKRPVFGLQATSRLDECGIAHAVTPAVMPRRRGMMSRAMMSSWSVRYS